MPTQFVTAASHPTSSVAARSPGAGANDRARTDATPVAPGPPPVASILAAEHVEHAVNVTNGPDARSTRGAEGARGECVGSVRRTIAARSSTAATAIWWRDPAVALPGVEPAGVLGVVVIAGVLVLLLGAGFLLLRRSGEPPSADDASGPPVEGRDGAAGDLDRSSDTGQSTAGVAPPLRTDEERVVQLLISNHGRMKQSQIVEETDWSKAKVSRLLSRMEESDQIVRTRAGRENIVQLADANVSILT